MLTKVEFAKLMKIHLNTLEKWIKNGLPIIQRGGIIRIDKYEAVTWLKENPTKMEEKEVST